MNNRTLQNTKGEQKNIITIAAAPAAHTSYLSSPPAAILHEKAQSVVLWLSPQHNPHATFMQPLQCVSRHHVSNPHVWTHIGNKSRRQSCSHSSAICNRRFQNTKITHTRTNASKAASSHRQAAGKKNHQNGRPPTAATRTRTRPYAHAHAHAHAHTHTRTRTRTRTHAHAHTRHARTRAHAHTRTRAHARTRTRAHTHMHTRTHPHTHTRTHKVPFIAACGHFSRKNPRFRTPASSPTQVPCNIHAAITLRFALSRV